MFGKAYEMDKKDPEKNISLMSIIWNDAEKWKTMAMIILMAVLALSNSVTLALLAIGITAEATGMAVLLVSVGYNLDSLSKKILAIANK